MLQTQYSTTRWLQSDEPEKETQAETPSLLNSRDRAMLTPWCRRCNKTARVLDTGKAYCIRCGKMWHPGYQVK